MTCVLNSTSGSGVWQPMNLQLCPADSCGMQGIVTSPNYPGNYPSNLNRTDVIQVQEGQVLALQFTAFNVESSSTCAYDHLTIRDGNGTTLMEKRCGSSLPANIIISTSNRVELHFKTDKGVTRSGWSVSWSARKQGDTVIQETVNVGQVICGKVRYQCQMRVAYENNCTIVSKVTPRCAPTKSKCTKGVLVSFTTASGCTVTGKYKNTGKRQTMSQLTISGSGA